MNNDTYLFSMYNIHNHRKKENKIVEKKIINDKFEKLQQYLKNTIKYKTHIIQLTKEYIDNPMKEIAPNVNIAFFNYITACIEHFDKTVETSSSDESDDENYLFDPYTKIKQPDSLLHNCFIPCEELLGRLQHRVSDKSNIEK